VFAWIDQVHQASNRVVPDSQVYLALDARLTGNRRGHAAPANLQQGWTQSLAHMRTSTEGVQTVRPRRYELRMNNLKRPKSEAQSHAVTWLDGSII
jgi:hypothetical protein